MTYFPDSVEAVQFRVMPLSRAVIHGERQTDGNQEKRYTLHLPYIKNRSKGTEVIKVRVGLHYAV